MHFSNDSIEVPPVHSTDACNGVENKPERSIPGMRTHIMVWDLHRNSFVAAKKEPASSSGLGGGTEKVDTVQN